MQQKRWLSSVLNEAKMSQAKAGYMAPKEDKKRYLPSGLFCCGTCNNFVEPASCKGVDGVIVRGGCCNNWENPSLATKP